MTIYDLNLTKRRGAKLNVIMEDDGGVLSQAMLPIYANMKDVTG